MRRKNKQNVAIVKSSGKAPTLIEKTITANGTYNASDDNADGYEKINVNVAGGSLKTLLDATKKLDWLFADYQTKTPTISDLISYNDTENVTSLYYAFKNTNNEIPLLNTSKVTNMTNTFYASTITTVPLLNTSKVTNMQGTFGWCRYLTTIPALDFSRVVSFQDTFSQCSNLEEIHATGMKYSFNISASTKFTESALVEILNNLATITSSRTLTMGSTNLAKLSADEIAIATNKGWTLA